VRITKHAYQESSDYDLKKPYKKELFSPDLRPYKIIDDSNEPAPPDVEAYKIASAFWGKFFEQKKEKVPKQFSDNSLDAVEVSKGAPRMFNQGFDVERDVYTSGYIL
jgi:hypothetical protein